MEAGESMQGGYFLNEESDGVTSFFTPLVPPIIIYIFELSARVSFTFTLPLHSPCLSSRDKRKNTLHSQAVQ
jgi:hypothetical protein